MDSRTIQIVGGDSLIVDSEELLNFESRRLRAQLCLGAQCAQTMTEYMISNFCEGLTDDLKLKFLEVMRINIDTRMLILREEMDC